MTLTTEYQKQIQTLMDKLARSDFRIFEAIAGLSLDTQASGAWFYRELKVGPQICDHLSYFSKWVYTVQRTMVSNRLYISLETAPVVVQKFLQLHRKDIATVELRLFEVSSPFKSLAERIQIANIYAWAIFVKNCDNAPEFGISWDTLSLLRTYFETLCRAFGFEEVIR